VHILNIHMRVYQADAKVNAPDLNLETSRWRTILINVQRELRAAYYTAGHRGTTNVSHRLSLDVGYDVPLNRQPSRVQVQSSLFVSLRLSRTRHNTFYKRWTNIRIVLNMSVRARFNSYAPRLNS